MTMLAADPAGSIAAQVADAGFDPKAATGKGRWRLVASCGGFHGRA